MTNNEQEVNESQPNPTPDKPSEGQGVSPQKMETEVNPGNVGNETEVDLDKSKIKTYPKSTPAERH